MSGFEEGNYRGLGHMSSGAVGHKSRQPCHLFEGPFPSCRSFSRER